ncbi:DUF3747 domain-containing protein [Limnoraphis robusta Tam1]|uniref:DUF3747 domain-containing protein n=1 Tax=Limnoraphis robusta CCNP1315 TaxID=3110306 RepID=A0ABU5TX89_9CYAN|nr:DUF3747 domain-containing protein [Limnoraphis robusta]MEA5498539.1 DUF3747 domain-containing protein [Limnoraphis robusta BA-68 BA1]MEA5519515.1 DUF3747 domain-containing protein [Limnoraphis robusta CCNP1315]MEA5543034.1 DUF3747 domain-containing protein [Limnoraphis robusta Tam1]MEA5547513.1 DUF3747 domain-containing protein [Limnoraphis robusta CCNP1324]
MKRALKRTFAALAMTVLSTLNVASEAIAVEFGKQEVQQERFIAIAVPRAYGYSLVIVEQVSNTTPCWSESGNNPIQVDPLLLNFDFTGICGRATDSNGYSVRMGEQDLALSHTLSVRGTGNEILLVATSRANPQEAPIVIGRTYGLSNGFTKILLEPGWRFTKRTYQDKTLGHIYFTNDISASAYSQSINPSPTNNGSSNSTDNSTSSKTDNSTSNRIYNRTSNKTDNSTANKTDNSTANKTDNSTANKTDNSTANKTDNSNANKTDNSSSNRTSNGIFGRLFKGILTGNSNRSR